MLWFKKIFLITLSNHGTGEQLPAKEKISPGREHDAASGAELGALRPAPVPEQVSLLRLSLLPLNPVNLLTLLFST